MRMKGGGDGDGGGIERSDFQKFIFFGVPV